MRVGFVLLLALSAAVCGCGSEDADPPSIDAAATVDAATTNDAAATADGQLRCAWDEVEDYVCVPVGENDCMATFSCRGQTQTVACMPMQDGRCVLGPSGEVCYTFPDLTPCTACRDSLDHCEAEPL